MEMSTEKNTSTGMKTDKDMNMDMDMKKSHYGRLLAMIGLSFLAMFVLMYAMVDKLANAVPNFNQFYMAGLMAAPMLILELLLMRAMYKDRKTNALLIGVGAVALIGFWMLIRLQGGIGDRQFLKSMITHHAGAILMCKRATIRDPEVKALCGDIISGQEGQIDQMKAKLKQLDD
uniref:PO3Cd1.9 n=1 Tax=uncultured Lysobacteraceae bacterium TaxID=211441 RepID=J9UX04_9GAMM|nr:pO3Cd1.9 [uncultured Xanthomonadaceae bacterium]